MAAKKIVDATVKAGRIIVVLNTDRLNFSNSNKVRSGVLT